MKRALAFAMTLVLLFGCTLCVQACAEENPGRIVPLSSAATDEYSAVMNESLACVAMYFGNLSQSFGKSFSIDSCTGFMGIVWYSENSLRTLKNGKKIADGGGLYSNESTFSIGGGCGIDDDSLWYFSIGFTDKATTNTIDYNTLALILAAERGEYIDLGGEDEMIQNAVELLNYLFMDEEDTGIVIDDVFFFRVTRNGHVTVGVDSMEFYENYNSSITNIYEADFKTPEA